MQKITLKTVPHKSQPYPTAGMWEFNQAGDLLVTVSRLGDKRMEILLAIHEMVEALLCEDRKITGEAVTKFDIAWEKKREKYSMKEPGDDPTAPYHREHIQALAIEALMANFLGVNWRVYEARLASLE